MGKIVQLLRRRLTSHTLRVQKHDFFPNHTNILTTIWLFGQNSFPHLADFRSGVWPKQKSEGRYNSDLHPKSFTTMMSTIPATSIQNTHFNVRRRVEGRGFSPCERPKVERREPPHTIIVIITGSRVVAPSLRRSLV
jgi:hypothetical protein